MSAPDAHPTPHSLTSKESTPGFASPLQTPKVALPCLARRQARWNKNAAPARQTQSPGLNTKASSPLSGHRHHSDFKSHSLSHLRLTLPAARLLHQPLERNKPDACAPPRYHTLSTESALRVLLLPTAFTVGPIYDTSTCT